MMRLAMPTMAFAETLGTVTPSNPNLRQKDPGDCISHC